MAVDRGKNTLRQARPLNLDGSLTVKDFVGNRDRDDLYRVSLGSRSQFSLKLSGVKPGAKVKAEVFALKDGNLGRIGKKEFSDLTQSQIRQKLTRLGRNSSAIDLTLDGGSYYLRLSPQRGESRYRLALSASPILGSSPSPTPGSSPSPSPSPTPGSSPSPSPSPSPSQVAKPRTLSWLRQFGSAGNDYAYGIATDSSNSVYVSGTTPQSSTSSTTDSFVTQFDSSGNQVWNRSFGSSDNDSAFDVAVDANGNYYVAGATNVTRTTSDGFLTKFDRSVSLAWSSSVLIASRVSFLGQRDAGDAISSVAIDTAGNVYVAGLTKAFPLASDPAKAFVAKYSADGVEQWFTEYGSVDGADAAAGVAIDPSGNVYITGVTNATLDLNSDDPLTGGDAFVAKFNSSGEFLWDQTLGTPNQSNVQEYGRAIAIDPAGSVYITGQTDGTLPGQTSAGGRDGFVARYSFDGTQIWVKQFGTATLDESQGIAVDIDGSIYLTGETGASLFGQTHAGGSDAWFAQFDSSGNRLSGQQIGTAANDEAYNLSFDSAGNLYVIGQTEGALGGTNSGAYDAWVAKYAP